jgi:integrase
MLEEPALPARGLRLDDLPPGLQRDLKALEAEMARPRRNGRGRRLRPSKASTIRTRKAEIVAFIGKAVECGFALDTLTSLEALLRPEVVESVLDRYWAENGDNPTVYTIDLAWKVLALARSLGAFDHAQLKRLDDMRAGLEQHRQTGLTEKNRALIRQVLVDEVWRSVMQVPEQLFASAKRKHNSAPVQAAVAASLAVAIRILIVAPIRVGNLASIRIGENLIRPAGFFGPYWIVFPRYDVKNDVPLEFELDAQTTALIDHYLAEFRPSLLRGTPSTWLFPGEDGDRKDPRTLSQQITERVQAATGVRLTGHQFRHAAAAVFLKHRPGEYELVRRLLGHRSITTTMNFYAGLEAIQATRIFGEIVERELKAGLAVSEAERRRASAERNKAQRRKVPA